MKAKILCGRVTARGSRQEIATAIISRTVRRATQSSWKSERVLKETRRFIQISTSEPSPERAMHTRTGLHIQKRIGVANVLPQNRQPNRSHHSAECAGEGRQGDSVANHDREKKSFCNCYL